MANPESTLELIQTVEDAMNEPTDGTSPFRTRIISYLDRAHKAIISGGQELNTDGQRPVVFYWAKSKYAKTKTLVAPVETGTVTTTQNSTTITFSTNITPSLAGYHIRLAGDEEVYRITAHTSGTNTATIDDGYIKTSASASSYTAFKIDYDFGSDILLPIGPVKAYSSSTRPRTLDIYPESVLEAKYPLSTVNEGFPEAAGLLKMSDGTLTMRLSHYPSEQERIELPYIPIPDTLVSGSVNPIVPKHHRLVIAELALYYILLQADDDRAKEHLRIAQAMFEALLIENKTFEEAANDAVGQLYPLEYDVHDDRSFLTTASGYTFGAFD